MSVIVESKITRKFNYNVIVDRQSRASPTTT